MFIKLSELSKESAVIKIQSVSKPVWKKWDEAERKYHTSNVPEKEFGKYYKIETDRGTIEISKSNLGTIHELYSDNGESRIIGRSVEIVDNGQTGKDIRYFFNGVYNPAPVETGEEEDGYEPPLPEYEF